MFDAKCFMYKVLCLTLLSELMTCTRSMLLTRNPLGFISWYVTLSNENAFALERNYISIYLIDLYILLMLSIVPQN